MYHHLNKVVPCSARPVILPKAKFMLDFSQETIKILMYLQENLQGVSFFSVKLQMWSLSTILLKLDFNTEIFQHAFCTSVIFKNLKNFLFLASIYRFLSVCFYHVTYAFQSESTLYSCLNVKELLARSRREI